MSHVNGTMESRATIDVVIADDHPIFIDAVNRLLSLEPGYQVVAQAKSGTEVLDLLREHSPEILLLDLRMPGLDGLQTLKRMKDEGIQTKVIVLSASEDQEDFSRARQFGALGIVGKQAATDVLLEAIQAVHRGESWFGERFSPWSNPVNVKTSPSVLSEREWQVARHVIEGCRNRTIGELLGISEQTVKNHLRRIFEKLGVSDRVEMALRVVEYQQKYQGRQ